jgi:uncharacterized protein YciI
MGRTYTTRLVLLFLASTLLLPAIGAGQQGDAAPTYRKANSKKIQGYIVMLRLRYDLYGKWKDTGKWPEDLQADEALKAHVEYWADQLRKGRVLMTGAMGGDYWDNVAMVLLDATSEGEAKQIASGDPAVKAYVFQAQVRPFEIHAITNKFGAGSQ